MQNSKPKAGDAVILTGHYTGVNPGDIGCIGGGLSAVIGSNLTFNPNSYRDDSCVSCGGGPGTFDLPVLHPTGMTVKMPFWRFKDGIREAYNTEQFTLAVPLWEYRGEGDHPVWGPQDVKVLLGDRILAHDTFKLFPRNWEKVEVFRGEFCLTNIGNRPNRDYMGEQLARLYRRRQLLSLHHHRVASVGCGYPYTVTQGSTTPLTAFRTLYELHKWLKAYGLSPVNEVRQDSVTVSTIVPNADYTTWQKLRAAHQPLE
ncbi:hypothetical protein HX798_23165 [Pseudomonas putida]|uniref:Uncharacterized protein n=1 Tax=Pseudomonas putida TaxID=303 RepID=A0A7Y8D4A5_PSEPU|nr:hypothetical protein [Pseudomonas putida]NWC83166.1 hypothetical protein [Pseudomonas putida]